MKKYLIMTMVIVSLLVTGLVVYAESEDLEVPEWFNVMMDWGRDEIDQAVEDGTLTAEEAEAWLDRIDDMEEIHLEEGFEGFGTGPCSSSGFVSGRSSRGGCRRGDY